MKNYQKRWKIMETMKNDEKQWKNDEKRWKTMKNYEKQWKTMKNSEKLWITVKNSEKRWKTMKNDEKQWKINLGGQCKSLKSTSRLLGVGLDIIFDILEPPAVQKYSICWVFLTVCHKLYLWICILYLRI